MRQSGEHRIAAPADAVWLALTDPDLLSQCIAATVKANIGSLSATVSADVRLADLDPPYACTVEANVKGGAAGFAKGVARISLTQEGRETLLSYEVEGNVGGRLAEAGERVIDAETRRMANDFFAKFGAVVTDAGAAAMERAPTERPSLLAPIIIAVAAVAALLALLRWRWPAARARVSAAPCGRI